MNDIAPIGRPAPTDLRGTSRTRSSEDQSTSPTRQGDQVEFSDAARLLSQLRQLPDVRQHLVDNVRAAIADGTYETDEKISAAVDGLLGELASEV